MGDRAARVLSARIDGVLFDLHRATILTRTDARGRRTWELTGWTGPIEATLHRRLVMDEAADVEVETTSGPLRARAVVSMMAVADASGSRTMVRIRTVDPH